MKKPELLAPGGQLGEIENSDRLRCGRGVYRR